MGYMDYCGKEFSLRANKGLLGIGIRILTTALSEALCRGVSGIVKGLIKGYNFNIRFAYSHFPISLTIHDASRVLLVSNVLGTKNTLVVRMGNGITVRNAESGKSDLTISGFSLEAVSGFLADIRRICRCNRGDVGTFVDGPYLTGS